MELGGLALRCERLGLRNPTFKVCDAAHAEVVQDAWTGLERTAMLFLWLDMATALSLSKKLLFEIGHWC